MIMMGIRIIPTGPNADHRSHGRATGPSAFRRGTFARSHF